MVPAWPEVGIFLKCKQGGVNVSILLAEPVKCEAPKETRTREDE